MITLVHGNKAKLKRATLALLRCKMTFEIFDLGLIAVQNDIQIFWAWPYCRAPVYFNYFWTIYFPHRFSQSWIVDVLVLDPFQMGHLVFNPYNIGHITFNQ